MIMRRMCAMRPPPIPVVNVEHPFTFYLLQNQAREHVVLFSGRLTAPK